ncbi:MAG: M15 family metallopeptidase [Deltaproteobacteria bacterium]
MKTLMKNRFFLLVFLLTLVFTGCSQKANVPEGFVYVKEMVPSAELDIRYYGSNNFTGRPVAGYQAPVAILTIETTRALADASKDLAGQGYSFKIFDAYRPQKAVNDFIRWAKEPDEERMKSRFYPRIEKKDLFSLGYLALKSGHSRGSTVDLTLMDKKTGKEVDMGSSFDFLDPISAHGSSDITPVQTANRQLLKSIMEKHGFKSYSGEWWHYTLINEPYPNQYFDFDVEQ